MDDDRWFQSYSLVYVTVNVLSMKKQIRYTFQPLTIDPGTRGWRIFESAFVEPPHLKIMLVKLEICPHKSEHQHEAHQNHWNHLVIPCRIPTSGKTQPLNLQRLKTRLGTWQPSIVEKTWNFPWSKGYSRIWTWHSTNWWPFRIAGPLDPCWLSWISGDSMIPHSN